MTWGSILLFIAASSSAAYLACYCYRPPSLARSVFKTAATGALALAALAMGAPSLLILALALGAFGDLMLSRDGASSFLTGLVAFALSHLTFVALFVLVGQAVFPPTTGASRIAGLALLGFGGAMARLLWHAAGALRLPVMAYVAIIVAMGLAALGLPIGTDTVLNRPIILLAAGLFILSDAVLASELFLLSDTARLRRVAPFGVWITYWSAQALFVAGYAVTQDA